MLFYIILISSFCLIIASYTTIMYVNKINSAENKPYKIFYKEPNRIIFFILIILFGLCVSNKFFPNDVFFTIPLGEDIFIHGVHHNEILSCHSDFKFYNVRWLFNVIIAFLNTHFGFFGIYAFVITVTIAIGITLYFCLYKIAKKNLLAFFITAFAMYLSRYYFLARAQIVSILILIIEYFSILMLTKWNNKNYIFVLLILPILLVNFHATLFPLYIILYLPFIVEDIISHFSFSKKFKLLKFNKSTNSKYLYSIFIINFFEALISPLGFVPYVMMFSTVGGVSKNLISEMQFLPLNSDLMIGFFIYFTLFLGAFLLKKQKTNAYTFFTFIGLSIISIVTNRSIFLLYMIGAFSIIEVLNDFLIENKNFFISFNKQYFTFLTVILIIVCCIVFIYTFINNLSQPYVDKTVYPVDATEYILNNIDLSKHTLYTGFNYGSYLEYKKIKVFLDSRAEIYESNYNNTTILKDYYDLLNYKDMDFKKFFDKYNITLALLYKKDDEYKKHLADNKLTVFNPIYEDEYFVLYEISK